MVDATSSDRLARVADSAGVAAAIFAALCCAGTPFIVSGLAVLGLSFLKRDAILWPLMLVSLAVALWGFWRGLRTHRRWGPITLALPSSLILAAGVIVVHGFPAMQMIWGSVVGLIVATVWNVLARHQVRVARNAGAPVA